MSKVVAFYGADHKVGTTQIAQCCCERIAHLFPEKEILFVLSDGGQGSLYCNRVCESLDRIRPYIAQSILDVYDLKQRAKCHDNLYIVGGSENPEFNDFFTPDIAEKFLESVKEVFDLVIVDAGSDINEGCIFGSLLAADRIYMLLRQCESSLRRIEWCRLLHEKLELTVDKYIINFFSSKSAYDIDYIAQRLCIDETAIEKIRDGHKGSQSESERASLVAIRASKAFIKDIDKLAKEIAEYAGI